MQRHAVPAFDPKPILAVLLEENVVGHELMDNEKKELIERYLDVSQDYGVFSLWSNLQYLIFCV